MAGEIIKRITAIMADVGHIGKDCRNQQQGFMFRGIDQVMNTMHPLLAKHGVVIIPEVVETKREERVTKSGGTLIYTMHRINYRFIADDGSEVVATVVGEGMDSADKSSNKAMAVAFKYACFQVFCIPTEEMVKDDPDAYSPEETVVTMETLERYLQNCSTKQDLAMFCEAYGSILKGNADAMTLYQQRKSEILNKK